MHIISCSSNKNIDSGNISVLDSTYHMIEDSLFVKVLLSNDSSYGVLNIYSFKNSQLKLVQRIDSIYGGMNVQIDTFEDYNIDGKKDILLFCGTGARGGNEINSLYLRKIFSDTFQYVKGSDGAPNLKIDKERNVIESMVLTGTTTFNDYIIDADSLKQIYSIDISFDSPLVVREHFEVNRGEYKSVKKDSVIFDEVEDIYSRPQ